MYKLITITVYPIKSMGGISLQKCLAERKGLQYDRRWMLVDEKGQFMTQRKYPQMALFQPFLTKNGVEVFCEYNDSVMIPWKAKGLTLSVKVWDDECKGIEVSKDISAWFSVKMNTVCRLVFIGDFQRKINHQYGNNQSVVSFADGYPYLLLGQASLQDLNTRLEKPISVDRFRPNLVIAGMEAFEEDKWSDFSIGNLSFVGIKPCARCIVTTIDQQSGKKLGDEPLKTLSTYRKVGNKVIFGLNVCALGEGSIKVGDEVIASSRQ